MKKLFVLFLIVLLSACENKHQHFTIGTAVAVEKIGVDVMVYTDTTGDGSPDLVAESLDTTEWSLGDSLVVDVRTINHFVVRKLQ